MIMENVPTYTGNTLLSETCSTFHFYLLISIKYSFLKLTNSNKHFILKIYSKLATYICDHDETVTSESHSPDLNITCVDSARRRNTRCVVQKRQSDVTRFVS
ncbi:unnamed protein product [Calicophoron daubneyi]|uniref:Uncharacterized protein n=1 Tax=Calicophoron daubneyi TaxID=300641 RepID=A0AAV2TBZ8_CALDB